MSDESERNILDEESQPSNDAPTWHNQVIEDGQVLATREQITFTGMFMKLSGLRNLRNQNDPDLVTDQPYLINMEQIMSVIPLYFHDPESFPPDEDTDQTLYGSLILLTDSKQAAWVAYSPREIYAAIESWNPAA